MIMQKIGLRKKKPSENTFFLRKTYADFKLRINFAQNITEKVAFTLFSHTIEPRITIIKTLRNIITLK